MYSKFLSPFNMKGLILILILSIATSCMAQPDVISSITVDDEDRLATVMLFFFAAVVLAGTYTTHHWESGEMRKKATRTYMPFAGEGAWAFVWAKAVWFGVYILLALAMWFTWFTGGQERIKWYWVWSFYGALLVLDKLWAYLYFYANRWANFGLVLAFLVGAIGFAIFGLLIAQVFLHSADIVGAGSNPINLIVGIVLIGVFSLIYLLVIFYNAYSLYTSRQGYQQVRGNAQMPNQQMQYAPQNYVQVQQQQPQYGFKMQ